MRYKEFNANRVLEKCILLFWKNGFASCAISDIVEETGVNRFSLYEEFDNKEGILKAALHLYQERYTLKKLEALNQGTSPHETMLNFYMSFLSEDGRHPSGCFVIHMGTELGDSNEDVKTFLNEYLIQIEKAIAKRLSKFEDFKSEKSFYAKHLAGLFITSMSFCLIHSMDERKQYIQNGIKVILEKTNQYA